MGNVYNSKQLYHLLKPRIEGDVSIDETDIISHSKDWSLFAVTPKIIVYPKHAADIQAVVLFVNEYKKDDPTLSITARSAGTDMTGGPLNESIILDVSRYMNKLVSIESDIDTGTARVQPGMFYRDFEKETLRKGLIMPCYPASREIAAVGGMVANNGAGEKTLKYGQNKDFVTSLQVVLDNGELCEIKPIKYKELQQKLLLTTREGELYRDVWTMIENNWDAIKNAKPTTSKNSAGYLLWEVLQSQSLAKFKVSHGYLDLTKLFVGAQGTTGIITEITYKLVSVKPMMHSRLVVSFLKDLEKLPQVVSTVLPHDPETFEVYDDNTFKIGVKFFADFLKHKGVFGAIRFGLSFIPELVMAFRFGVPKLILMAEFAGETEQIVVEKCKKVSNEISALGIKNRITHSAVDAEKYWEFRHDSFKLLTEHSKKGKDGLGTRTAPFIDDIIVDPKHFPEFLPKLDMILKPYNLLYTVAGHIGDGNLHIIPLMDMHDEKNKTAVLELMPKVYELVRQYGGSITAEHNDGIIRTPYLYLQFSPDIIELFKKTKNIFDPHNIFNPNKKVGGTVEYLKKHFAQ